jgi:DNA-binding IclR family transcriptional regulator
VIIKSVEKALRILCYMATKPKMGPSEISQDLKYDKSTVIRLLQTMELLDFVKQEHDKGRYELGSKVLQLAQKFLEHRDDIVSLAVDQIRALWENYHETVGLYAREGDTRICIFRLESPQSLRHSVRVGQVLPLHRGAAGKAFLAYMPQHEVESLLVRCNVDSAHIDVLRHELPEIRRTGIAYSLGEREPGLTSVAAPILDRQETPIAVLVMSGPEQRLGPDRLRELAKPLSVAAHTVSSRIVGRYASVGSRS